MSQFDLAALGKRRKPVALAPIKPTHAQMLTLLAIYLAVVKLWSEAAHRITAAYGAGHSEGTPMATDANREIERTASEAQRILLVTAPVFLVWASRVEKVHQAKWVKAVMAATKVDIGPFLSPADMNAILKTSADWNAALIKDLSNEMQRRISNIVFSGFQSKTSVFDVAKEISKTVGMARGRARNIAVDQLNKLGAAMNKARMDQAGITHFQWIHSAKLHPRPVHLARNYEVFPWEGEGSIAPDDQPGIPPFCGCVARAVVTTAISEPTA